jgi:hypothetical protein
MYIEKKNRKKEIYEEKQTKKGYVITYYQYSALSKRMSTSQYTTNHGHPNIFAHIPLYHLIVE